jgi:2-iminobutanoate/2-iminopropanoate deaminase
MNNADSHPEGSPLARPVRQIVKTSNAPAAVGPYSQAVRASGLVYTSGLIGLDPATGHMVGGGVAAETRQALANAQAVLEAAGTSLGQVLKTTVYLTDMADFRTMNDVYSAFFPVDPPARTTVSVVALPLGARVAIEAVARGAP